MAVYNCMSIDSAARALGLYNYLTDRKHENHENMIIESDPRPNPMPIERALEIAKASRDALNLGKKRGKPFKVIAHGETFAFPPHSNFTPEERSKLFDFIKKDAVGDFWSSVALHLHPVDGALDAHAVSMAYGGPNWLMPRRGNRQENSWRRCRVQLAAFVTNLNSAREKKGQHPIPLNPDQMLANQTGKVDSTDIANIAKTDEGLLWIQDHFSLFSVRWSNQHRTIKARRSADKEEEDFMPQIWARLSLNRNSRNTFRKLQNRRNRTEEIVKDKQKSRRADQHVSAKIKDVHRRQTIN